MAGYAYRKILKRIDEDDLVRICTELIRFRSVNPPGNELEIAKYVGAMLSQAGLEVDVMEHTPDRGSVVARLKGTGELPALVYSGHLDVVPAEEDDWLYPPFEGRVAEGKIWGRGSTDMKSGDAAILAAARVLAAEEVPLRGDLVLAFTAGEETDNFGAVEILKNRDLGPAQAIFIPEPSNNGVFIAEKGALWVEITTRGKAAHISNIRDGRNALMMMMPILSELDRLEVPYESHALLGDFARSINTISAGTKTNTIPPQCVATVDQRTVPGQDHAEIVQGIEDLVADVGKRSDIEDFRASVRVILDNPPLETSSEDPVVKRFYELVEEITAERPEDRGVGYFTDAARFTPALNAPFIICGPGNPSLNHKKDEWVEIVKLVDAARIYTLTATEFLT